MFLDTSGLFRVAHRDEPGHEEAGEFFVLAPQLLTHNYVLAEFIALGNARGMDRREVLNFANTLGLLSTLKMVWVGPKLHARAMTMLATQRDKEYSLCDAVSFLLMRPSGITEALTTDHHFEQAGFVRLLRP